MGSLMSTMDFSIINIAFPTLTKVFHTPLPKVMWVTLAYILVSTSSMMILGKISDLWGRKRIYSLGSLVITLALAAASFSQSIGQLVFFRAVQALGAAMVLSSGTAIIIEAFPTNERGKGLGLMTIFVSMGFIIGPVVGGVLLNWLNWQSLFYIRVPFGLMIWVMTLTFLKQEIKTPGSIRLDLWGALLSSGTIFCIVFGISRINDWGYRSPWVILFLGASLFLLIVLVLVEGHVRDPIIDLALFHNKVFSNASLGLFLFFMSHPPLFLLMPFYFIQGLEITPSHAGLLLAVPAMLTIVFGPISGKLSDTFDPVWFMILGAAMITLTFCLMLTFDLHTSFFTIILLLSFTGLAFGIFGPPSNSIIMGSVPKDRLGTASALIATLRQVGVSIGLAVTGTIYTVRNEYYKKEFIQNDLPALDTEHMAIPPAFHDALIFSIVLGFVTTFICLYILKNIRREEKTTCETQL
jgi:EmrB/QacA subfamily drug resistance transporter